MKNFLQQVKSSVYDSDFYQKLDTKDSSFTILYILKLWGLLSLLTALVIVVMVHQYQSNVFKNAGVDSLSGLANRYIETYFADDLIITFNNFVLTTNKTEPVIFPTPKDWFNLDTEEAEDIPSNLFVISPNESSTRETMEKYDTIGVFSSTSVAYFDNSQNTIKVTNFADIKDQISEEVDNENFVITKEIAKNKLNELIGYFAYVLPFLYLIIFLAIFLVMFVFMSLFEFIFAIFTGLITYLIAMFTKVGGGYGSWYLKALHAATPYILLTSTIGWFVPLSSIPLLSTLTILVTLYINKSFTK